MPAPGTANRQLPGRWRAGRGPLAGLLILIAALGVVLAAPPRPAYAHAQLVSTTPANGARLDTAPAEVVLRFSERVNLVRDGVKLLATGGGAVRGVGAARIDPAAPAEVRVPLPPDLGSGSYTVSWRVVSVDSHPIHGAFVFGVGDVQVGQLPDSGAQTSADPTVSTVFWLFRWLGYAGLALLAGGALFLLGCWPAGWRRPRARRLLAIGWGGSLVCAVAVLLLQGPYGAGASLGRVVDPSLLSGTLGTDYGRFLILRLVLLAAGGALLYAIARSGPRRALGIPAALVLGLGLPATWVGTGHANAGTSILVAAADTLHLAAMATWLGGLAHLVLCVLPRSAERPVGEVAGAVTRFSRIAAGCVALLVATGTYQAVRGVGSFDALAGSSYGMLLVLKLSAVGVLLWFGAVSRSVVRRRYLLPAVQAASSRTRRQNERELDRLARARLRWSVRTELMIAAGVLGLTSVLVATPPAARPEAAAAETPASPVVSVQATLSGGGTVAVRLDPAVAGTNALTLSVRDPAGRAWGVPEVSAALRLAQPDLGPLEISLTETGPGEYRSQELNLPVAGAWRLQVKVRTTEIDQVTAELVLPVA